jgi:hypothetical protein
MEIVQKVYELLKNIALNNQESQVFLSKFLGSLTKYIGYGDFVSNTLMVIVNNNDEILMNFSKHSNSAATVNTAPNTGSHSPSNIGSKQETLESGLNFFMTTIDY